MIDRSVLPRWRDFLPPDATQAKVGAEEALRAARRSASKRDLTASNDAIAATLADAAAETIKFAALFGTDAHEMAQEYALNPRFFEGLTTSASADAVAGVLAYHAATSLVGTHPPRADVGALARFVGPHPLLAHGALAFGLDDAARLGAPLARALATRDRRPFLDAIATFPETELGYAELGCIVRALVVHVDGDDAKRGARWLHRYVNEGIEAPLDPEPPTAPPVEPSANVAALLAALPLPPPHLLAAAAELLSPGPFPRPPLGWSNVVLQDVHGLWGGRMTAVSARGEVWVVDVLGGRLARRLHAHLSVAAFERLDKLLRDHDPRTIRIPMRNGIAGEALPSLTFVAGGQSHVVSKWATDRHPDFDPVASFLHRVGEALAATGTPLEVGRWTGRFERM